MAIYVIGDVHGCRATLESLWKQLPFAKKEDELWLAGDLVNRGPDSLGVLRWAMRKQERLGDRFRCVLGNHDLHLLAVAHGQAKPRPKDTLDEVLHSRANELLIDWLLSLPVVARQQDLMMVHAGLMPQWSWDETERRGRKIAKALRSQRAEELLGAHLRHASGGSTTRNDVVLKGLAARARDLFVLTRIRTCDKRGTTSTFSGPPRRAPAGFRPWFEQRGKEGPGGDARDRKRRGKKDRSSDGRSPRGTVFFGHWAALGLYLGRHHVGVDSGCVWGRRLSAVRWPDLRVFQQACID